MIRHSSNLSRSGASDKPGAVQNALGTTALKWSDLFLASGAVINMNNGDVTLTHAADQLTLAIDASDRFRIDKR